MTFEWTYRDDANETVLTIVQSQTRPLRISIRVDDHYAVAHLPPDVLTRVVDVLVSLLPPSQDITATDRAADVRSV